MPPNNVFEVLLPLPIPGLFTYEGPDSIGEKSLIGRRVLVPFGKNKIHTGIVWRESLSPLAFRHHAGEAQQTPNAEHRTPNTETIKPILSVLDNSPILTPTQMQLWEWIASYYMCTLGEVMKAALPTALKLESETRVQRVLDFEADHRLSPNQEKVLDFLSDNKVKNIDEIGKKLGISYVMPALNRLLEMGAVQIEEAVPERYKPKTEKYISLAQPFSEIELQLLLDSLSRSKQQQKCLMAFLEQATPSLAQQSPTEIERTAFLSSTGFSAAILKQLVDKSILAIREKEVLRRTEQTEQKQNTSFTLSPAQQRAFEQINSLWAEKQVVLLHGVTSSGKTEVYTKLIEQTIAQGKQVLYLVPEIALTTQLTERLQRVFGDRLAVYHSRFSDNERVDIYRAFIEKNTYDIVLGARSAIFLPLSNLGLIIIDEEHDPSYKQQDPAPRYHARAAAIMLAQFTQAKVLLGTATPAIETYYNAQNGKYGLVELHERYAGLDLPQITLVDTKEQYRRKQMTGHFSDVLTQRITDELGKNKQTIVFQNRRGFAHYLECKQCGYVPKCTNCDVSLTVHERQGILSCHYCGYTTTIPTVCPACQTTSLTDKGFGTEKVEDELQTIFPETKIARMDLDTTRNKNAHQHLISRFAHHEIDILVGTQMVSKGLDFDDVSTVAVLNADNLMNNPDFRAYEQAYQMLEQVSGRAGRKGETGEVIIQTFQPENPVLSYVVNHDYQGFYHQQILERKAFKYPPFFRILSISIRMRDIHLIDQVSAQLQAQLAAVFQHRCSRVIIPQISRVQNQYIRTIMLKIEATASYAKAKELLQEQINYIRTTPNGKAAQVIINVDPL